MKNGFPGFNVLKKNKTDLGNFSIRHMEPETQTEPNKSFKHMKINIIQSNKTQQKTKPTYGIL